MFVFYIRGSNLILGESFEIQFWQYWIKILKGNLIDFEIEQNSFLY